MPEILQQQTERRCRNFRWAVCLALLLGLAGLTANASIVIKRFEAAAQPDGSIEVVWETATEFDIMAFNLYRATSGAGPWDHRVDQQEARGDGFTGAIYQYRDADVQPGLRYYYLLEEVTSSGPGQRHGPISARIGAEWILYLPLIGN